MDEHNPPPPADSACVPVIPLPIALYVSEGLIFELYDGGQPSCSFRSVGRGSFRQRKMRRGQPLKVRKRSHAHTKSSAGALLPTQSERPT